MKRITALVLACTLAASGSMAQEAVATAQPVGSFGAAGAGGLASGPAIAALAALLVVVAVASGSGDDDDSSSTTTTE